MGTDGKYHQVQLHVDEDMNIFCILTQFLVDSYPAVLPHSQEMAASTITIETANHFFSPTFRGIEKCL